MAQFLNFGRCVGFIFAMFLLLVPRAGVVAQSSTNCGECSLYGSDDKSRGRAVIFGKNYEVPELHLRFIDQSTGKPISPKYVNVHYVWLWLEYPYPEHPWGAWSDAEDWVRCTTGESETTVPAFTVKPRGWYAGKYAKFPSERKPKFDRIEIVMELEKCAPRLVIKSSELSRYRNATAVVKLSCGAPEEVTFEPR
jgi:hypothetical protein